MATISVGADPMSGVSKRLERCRIVDVALTNIADSDTYSVGPGCVAAAFIETAAGQSGEGEVGCLLSRTAETVTFDCAVTANGTLRLFYGYGG